MTKRGAAPSKRRSHAALVPGVGPAARICGPAAWGQSQLDGVLRRKRVRGRAQAGSRYLDHFTSEGVPDGLDGGRDWYAATTIKPAHRAEQTGAALASPPHASQSPGVFGSDATAAMVAPAWGALPLCDGNPATRARVSSQTRCHRVSNISPVETQNPVWPNVFPIDSPLHVQQLCPVTDWTKKAR